MKKKIIEDYYKVIDFNKRKVSDLDTAVNYYAEEAIFQFVSNPPLKGRAAIRMALSGITGQFSEMEHIVHRVVTDEDLIALEGSACLKRPDGKRIEFRFASFFEVKGEKITYHRVYGDSALFT